MSERKHDPAWVDKAAERIDSLTDEPMWSCVVIARAVLDAVADDIATAERDRVVAELSQQVKDCRRAGGGLYSADFIAGLAWANALVASECLRGGEGS